ncbi:hypothetical protein [Nocardioides antri]|uniref:hypothetical protein n=1 Tax=Nocardioides antri TaxID=2607659 RepID=UPI00165F8060|nr:hypothetical protein [Nocardioides antri]
MVDVHPAVRDRQVPPPHHPLNVVVGETLLEELATRDDAALYGEWELQVALVDAGHGGPVAIVVAGYTCPRAPCENKRSIEVLRVCFVGE